MKLSIVYPEIVDRMKYLKSRADVPAYAEKLKASGNFKDFRTRLAYDLLHACFSSSDLCAWYDLYDCNDTHITTAAKAAMQEVFGF